MTHLEYEDVDSTFTESTIRVEPLDVRLFRVDIRPFRMNGRPLHMFAQLDNDPKR